MTSAGQRMSTADAAADTCSVGYDRVRPGCMPLSAPAGKYAWREAAGAFPDARHPRSVWRGTYSSIPRTSWKAGRGRQAALHCGGEAVKRRCACARPHAEGLASRCACLWGGIWHAPTPCPAAAVHLWTSRCVQGAEFHPPTILLVHFNHGRAVAWTPSCLAPSDAGTSHGTAQLTGSHPGLAPREITLRR